jgi:hypothetical protein
MASKSAGTPFLSSIDRYRKLGVKNESLYMTAPYAKLSIRSGGLHSMERASFDEVLAKKLTVDSRRPMTAIKRAIRIRLHPDLA